MIAAITSLSRISILILIGVFTLSDLCLLLPKSGRIYKGFFGMLQTLSTVLFLANASCIIYLNTKENTVLFLFIGQLLFIFIGSYFLETIVDPTSSPLLKNMFMLLSISFVVLERLDFTKAVKQFVFACVALVIAYILLAVFKKTSLAKEGYILYGFVGAVFLGLVQSIGTVEYGARLSLHYGYFNIQPSEFVKIIFVFFIASVCAKFEGLKGIIIATAGAFVHILFLALSKDFGSALIFIAIYVFMIFVAYRNYVVLLGQIVLGVAFGLFAYKNYTHIQTRFLAWQDPLKYVDDQGYQISQSLFAIGAGGLYGSGIYQGMPEKIPVVTKDFVFSAICEEMGGLFGICIIIIFICSVIYIMTVANRLKDKFYQLITFGIGISLITQAFLNIGGVTNFIPATGVTLPFVSYGGSSLLACFISVCIVEGTRDFAITDLKKNSGRKINEQGTK